MAFHSGLGSGVSGLGSLSSSLSIPGRGMVRRTPAKVGRSPRLEDKKTNSEHTPLSCSSLNVQSLFCLSVNSALFKELCVKNGALRTSSRLCYQ